MLINSNINIRNLAIEKVAIEKKDPPEGGPKMRVNAFVRRDLPDLLRSCAVSLEVAHREYGDTVAIIFFFSVSSIYLGVARLRLAAQPTSPNPASIMA